MTPELQALDHVEFPTMATGDDIWRDDVIHVDGIHSWPLFRIQDTLARLRKGVPVGNLVIQGRPGIGKSHFLGRVRHAVIEQGHVFVLFQPSTARRFWDSLALAYMDALHRDVGEGRTQLRTVLHRLGEAIGLQQAEIEDFVAGTFDLAHLSGVRRSLQMHLGRRPGDRVAVDVALALILTNSEDFAHQDIGYAALQGVEVDVDQARAHAILANRIPCREIVGAFDRLIGAAGCATLVAIDQIDGLLALGRLLDGAEQQTLLDQMAAGLMDLAEDVRHSLIVVSCLTDSWTLIRDQALAPAHDRYPTVVLLRPVPSADVGEALIAAYLRVAYARAGFTPEYPTWPVKPTAFADAPLFSPRSLINVVQNHCAHCVEQGRVTELAQLPNKSMGPEPSPSEPPGGVEVTTSDSPPDPDLDRRFSELVREADVTDALDEKKVDAGLPVLLRAGLMAWAEENAAAGDFSVDPPLGRNPSLHARLRQTVDADTDDEVHWSFRAVLNHNPVAALRRLRAAVTASGLELSAERRRLFILRNTAWSRGRKTQQALEGLGGHGGTVAELLEADLRVFRAVERLRDERPQGLAAWLQAQRHASRTALLAPLSPESSGGEAEAAAAPPGPAGPPKLAAPPTPAAPPKVSVAPGRAASSKPAAASSAAGEDCIPIGIAADTGRPVSVPLEHLRRHTVIFAGLGLRQDRPRAPAHRGVRAEGRFGRGARSEQRPRAARSGVAGAAPGLARRRRREGGRLPSRHRGRRVGRRA